MTRVLLLLALGLCLGSSHAQMSPSRIQEAIDYGATFKTTDKFLSKGLKGERVKLASAMALDGISKYATFYDDWNAIAAESAAANQQMRHLAVADFTPTNSIHCFVEIHARGSIPVSKMNRRYLGDRAHLVLVSESETIQPLAKQMLMRSDQSVLSIVLGMPTGKITLRYDFPANSLTRPVEIVLIDADGNKHRGNADLSGLVK